MEGLDVSHAIIPILRLSSSGSVLEISGTGFFVGKRPYVVTAKHVFEDYPLKKDETFGIAFLDENEKVKIGTITDYRKSPYFDIAVFAAGGISNVVPLPISRNKVPSNQNILTYEFSSTSIEIVDNQRVVNFDPYTHKGNVLHHYVSNFPEKIPTPAMDISFPALQGASGAPVMRETDFAVVGMIVANRERHLMPAQVVKIESDNKTVEEVKYFLPTGKAIEGSLIADFLIAGNAADINFIE